MTRRALERRALGGGEDPALWRWREVVPFGKVGFNYLLMSFARVSPSLGFKNHLYRAMGAKVGRRVAVGLEVNFDIFWPELITIEDQATIGFGTTILCHEFLYDEFRTGPVVIGARATIGANTTILPGVRIAPDTIVSAHSLVNSDVEGFVGGVPARPLKRHRRRPPKDGT